MKREKVKSMKWTMAQKIGMFAAAIVTVALIIVAVSGSYNLNRFANQTLHENVDTALRSGTLKLEDYYWGIYFRMSSIAKMGIIEDDLSNDEDINIERIITGLKGATDVIKRVYVRELDGNIIAVPKDEKTVKAIEDQWTTAFVEQYKNEKDRIYPGILADPYGAGHIVPIIVPILENDQVIGHMGMDIDSEDVRIYMSDYSFGKTGHILVTDAQGNMISNGLETGITGKPYPNQDLRNHITTEALGQGSTKINGEDYIYGFDRIADPNWTVVSLIAAHEYSGYTEKAILINTAIIIVLIVLALIISWYVGDKLTKRLRDVTQGIKQLGEGDLTVQINTYGNDEILELAENVNEAIGQFQHNLISTHKGAEQLGESTERLVVAQQAVVNTSEEISQDVKGIMKQCHHQSVRAQNLMAQTDSLNQLANETNQSLLNMGTVCDKVAQNSQQSMMNVESLQKVSGQNQELLDSLGGKLKEITERSREIDSVVDTIKNITDQTNLLALNASIEAARAGEAGKGFAVVANEINKLSAQSQEATVNISEIIRQVNTDTQVLTQEVEKIVATMKIQNEAIDAQQVTFKEGMIGFKELENTIALIDDTTSCMIRKQHEINKNLKDVVENVENIEERIDNISNATTHQTNLLEEVASHTEEFAKLGKSLKQSVQKFRV
ncbi:MAG: methyl-accepting chemotaxis protein [Cellulosilyticaceae bacterium]